MAVVVSDGALRTGGCRSEPRCCTSRASNCGAPRKRPRGHTAMLLRCGTEVKISGAGLPIGASQRHWTRVSNTASRFLWQSETGRWQATQRAPQSTSCSLRLAVIATTRAPAGVRRHDWRSGLDRHPLRSAARARRRHTRCASGHAQCLGMASRPSVRTQRCVAGRGLGPPRNPAVRRGLSVEPGGGHPPRLFGFPRATDLIGGFQSLESGGAARQTLRASLISPPRRRLRRPSPNSRIRGGAGVPGQAPQSSLRDKDEEPNQARSECSFAREATRRSRFDSPCRHGVAARRRPASPARA